MTPQTGKAVALTALLGMATAGATGKLSYDAGTKAAQQNEPHVAAGMECADWQRETDRHSGVCPHPEHRLRLEERADKSFVVCACPVAHAEIPVEQWLHPGDKTRLRCSVRDTRIKSDFNDSSDQTFWCEAMQ